MSTPYFDEITSAMASVPSFDGLPAKLVHLTNANGMTASFMDIGATWLSCSLPVSGRREVLLRAENMQEHLKQEAYLGAVVGRFANRIAGSRFEINGLEYQVDANEKTNSLHGGTVGFDKQRWKIEARSPQSVTFSLSSPDGDQGYPGNLNVVVTYTLTDTNAVKIEYLAEVDKDCPVNLTNHAYFNLAGEPAKDDCRQHSLQMQGLHYLPTSSDMLPLGELKAVENTGFDFSSEKLIEQDFMLDDDQKTASGYDHAYVLDASMTDGEQVVAKVTSPQRDVVMTMATTMPAVQLYTGNFLTGVEGRSGTYLNHAGLALETQYLPDGPNHKEWGDKCGILKSGQPYQHKTIYQFEF